MARHSSVQTAATLALTAGMVAAWSLPSASDAEFFGRYSAIHLLLAVIVTAGCLAVVAWRYVWTGRIARLRLLAVIAATTVGWLGAEAILFVADPWKPNPFYSQIDPSATQADAWLRYRRPPNMSWEGLNVGDMGPGDPYAEHVTFQTDSDGFRNPRDLDEVDIAFVGDSFTEAGNIPAEKSFVRLTADLLSRATGCWAVSGYGPVEELAALRRFALKRRPQYVVWQLYEGNDLWDIIEYINHTKSDDDTARGPFDAILQSTAFRWKRSSPFLKLAGLVGRRATLFPYELEGRFTTRDQGVIPIRYRALPSEHTDPEFLPFRWANLAECLQNGDEACLDQDVTLIVIFIPVKLRVTGPVTDFTGLDGDDRLSDMGPDSKFAQALRQLTSDDGIEYLDLTAPLREAADGGDVVYFPFDTHLAPAGHAIVAGAIADHIRHLEGDRDAPDGD